MKTRKNDGGELALTRFGEGDRTKTTRMVVDPRNFGMQMIQNRARLRNEDKH